MLRRRCRRTPAAFGRRTRVIAGIAANVAVLLLAANLLFWALVAARFSPIEQSYLEGRVVWLGRHVMVFGHGYWSRDDGFWQHQTMTKLGDGTKYDGPTLDLIARLHREGATSVWGSWCYSGDFPYIRKDLVTGRTTPWPSYSSYNRTPGITIPIWLGAAFVRLGWPSPDYVDAPDVISYRVPDTMRIGRPSLQHFVSTFYTIRGPRADLPNPDSLSWDMKPGEKHSISWQDYVSLPWHEKWAVREFNPDLAATGAETEEASAADSSASPAPLARTGTIRFWIRGRSFPVHIRVPDT